MVLGVSSGIKRGGSSDRSQVGDSIARVSTTLSTCVKDEYDYNLIYRFSV